jgi:PEP-CTERM motif
MKYSKYVAITATILVAIYVFGPRSARSAQPSIADFQNFSAQLISASFTDPKSGIVFSNSQNSGGVFGIQDSSTYHFSSAPTFLPTIYLTGNGITTDTSGAIVAGDFGFDAALPGAAFLPAAFRSISVAIFYFSPTDAGGAVTLQGFDTANNVVASAVRNINQSDWGESSITISATSPSISKFSIRASGLSTGYDNITFTAVPEPSTLTLLAIGAVGLVAMRRSARTTA